MAALRIIHWLNCYVLSLLGPDPPDWSLVRSATWPALGFLCRIEMWQVENHGAHSGRRGNCGRLLLTYIATTYLAWLADG